MQRHLYSYWSRTIFRDCCNMSHPNLANTKHNISYTYRCTFSYHVETDICVLAEQARKMRHKSRDGLKEGHQKSLKALNWSEKELKEEAYAQVKWTSLSLSTLNEPPATGPPCFSPRRQWGYYRVGHQTSPCVIILPASELSEGSTASHFETPKCSC